MTLASTDPHAASAFCQKYLGAVHHPMSSKVAPDGGNECKTLAWVEFAHTKIRQHIPTQYRAQHIESFHLHFVKHQHRPSGSLSIHDFETALLHAHRNFTVWDAWMDYRLTMEASSLNSLVTQLAVAGLPFLARQNADGTASVVTAIPHAAMVLELVTPQLELLVLTQWNRCREAPQLVWTDAGRRQVAAARQGMEVPPQLRLWPRRFVFPTSSHAKAAARFVTSYFEAEPVAANSDSKPETCFDAHGVWWPGAHGDLGVELWWIQREPELTGLSVHTFEDHLQGMHGDLSRRSSTNWHQFLDYKVGLMFDDCARAFFRYGDGARNQAGTAGS